MSEPITAPPADPATGDPAVTDPPAADPAVTDPPEPNSLEERLRRRQAALDAARDRLKPWQDLGVTPDDVAALLAARKGAKPAEPAEAVDVEAIRAEARREASAEADRRASERILQADLKAAAAGLLTDQTDALRFIDMKSIDLGADGTAHPDDLAEAVAELLRKRPYLAKAQAPAARQFGNGDNGVRPPGPQRTVAQQIAAAEEAGDHKTSMALKAGLLFEGKTTS